MRKSRFTGEEGTVAPVGPRTLRRTDHWDDQGARSRNGDGGGLSPSRSQPGDVLQAQGQVWRHGRVRCPEAEGAGMRRTAPNENGKLKRLLADAMLDNVVLKDLLGSKPWDATGPRTMAEA